MTSIDLFLGGKLKIKQPRVGYRAGTDAVLLASALPLRGGDHLVDLGTGVGTVMLCAASRVPNIQLTGIDVNGSNLSYARENLEINGFEGRLIHADLRVHQAFSVMPEEVDCVSFNPPYFDPKSQTPPVHQQRAQSRHHEDGSAFPLDEWVRTAARLLRERGVVVFIYPAEGLGDALSALARPESPGRSWGGIEIFPLWSRTGKPAKRVIVRARKNSRSPLRILAGQIMHQEDGTYTPKIEDVCRHGKGLF